MCSKKWAKPDLPGSTSFREPVFTGIWRETMFGKPVGTTMTFRPFASVVSVAWKGRMSVAASADFGAGPGEWRLRGRLRRRGGRGQGRGAW